MIVREAIAAAISRLASAGVDTPRLDAELLLAHVLGEHRTYLFAHPKRELSAPESESFEQLLARRQTREPLPYLLGTWEFMGLPFLVSPAVLIPRPETETLVETVAQRLPPNARILDVGAGSGCISIALARLLPEAEIIALEPSAAAVDVARRNCEALGVSDRVRIVQGSFPKDIGPQLPPPTHPLTHSPAHPLTRSPNPKDEGGRMKAELESQSQVQPLTSTDWRGADHRLGFPAPGTAPRAEGPPESSPTPAPTHPPPTAHGPLLTFTNLDAVVSNPPYIPSAGIAALEPELRQYEPRQALDGGSDGLTVLRALAQKSAALLKPGGLLAVEVAMGQAEEVESLLREAGGWTHATVIPDLAGIPRVVTARRILPRTG